MLTGLPTYVNFIFLATVVLTFCLFVWAARNKGVVAIVLTGWLALTGALSYNGFFQNTSVTPPRLMLVMVPALLFIILLLVTKNGRAFADGLDLKKLTLFHVVRLPVEITLYLLAANKFIPELMTFAGRNFDILSGISAPVIYFLCFNPGSSQVKNRTLLLAWNFICLGLLLNIVINAVLSIPYPFQQFAFDQPNIAVLYFPFTWLPAFIVVLVLFSHLVAIRQLLRKRV